ncbi:helix-turn-helix transcriptional regulator [Rhodobacter sp. NTK016B]|uniref:winged helix-turn-helix transcriptional regulator n=1 Tax=Rhodobacter sp. NTK016B TaxID=2759676 RepID=UPI001A8E55A1|nr:helix-turn-helix domain-containing protein [Rhodobacter sp. NTK016B]MBN8290450.1 helix-turn-helix transcriptional regulator [Rhodobacter sp. NTK016B]
MSRNGYNEGCLAAHALDLIGDRWALLVLRELMLGPKRFGLIKAGLPGIATNILTRRLEALEASGLLRHHRLPPPASVAVYELTEAGLATRDVIDALCRWGVQQPGHDPTKFISPTALMLSMRVMVRPDRVTSPIEAGFIMGDERFTARLDMTGFTPRPAPGALPALTFSGSGNTLAIAVYGPSPVAPLAAGGVIGLAGDPDTAQRFVDAFRLGA